jgi:hypothetical protein
MVKALIEQQQAALASKDAALAAKDFKIEALTRELAYLKRIRYGKASEVLTGEQRLLFEEMVDMDLAAIEQELENETQPKPKNQRKHPGRQTLPPELPRIEHRHEPESCLCGQCGAGLVKIGEDASEQLDVEPARFFVHRHIRPQYACRACETVTAAAIPPAVIDGLGRAAAGRHSALGCQQPGVQVGQRRHGLLLAHGESLFGCHAVRQLFDGVKLGDTAQCLRGHGAGIGGVHVEKFAADVGQASQLDRSLRKQGLVADIVIDHQVSAPVLQESAGMGACPAFLVVEDDDGRAILPRASAIRPQVCLFGFAAARIELPDRRFVGMQASALPEQFGKPVSQRLHRNADTADPVGQRRAG